MIKKIIKIEVEVEITYPSKRENGEKIATDEALRIVKCASITSGEEGIRPLSSKLIKS